MSDDKIPNRISIDLTRVAYDEVQRIIEATSLKSALDFFLNAINLLRIYVEAAQEGKEIIIIDPQNHNSRKSITLPFNVRRGS